MQLMINININLLALLEWRFHIVNPHLCLLNKYWASQLIGTAIGAGTAVGTAIGTASNSFGEETLLMRVGVHRRIASITEQGKTKVRR